MDEPEVTIPSSLNAEAAGPPAADSVSAPPTPPESPLPAASVAPGGSRNWSGIALFLVGVLAGVIGFALFTRLTTTPAADTVAMRDAARAGTLDAIATLQAGGPTAAESAVTPTPVVVNTNFDLRAANRTGNPDAPVTIVEFSDFQ